ncbi:MAG: ABC transporter substrate-binding protein [Thermodesulfobacteriota bacterium]
MTRKLFSNPLIFGVVISLILVAAVGKIKAAEKIKFGTPVKLSPVLYLPVLAGEERGFWKKNNVSVEWLPFRGGSALYRGIAANSVEMGVSSTGSHMRAAGRGVPVVIVAESNRSQDFIVWVRADSRFKNPRDLKGARIGVPRLGGSSHGFGLVIVKALGLEKDVKFLGMGGIRPEPAALKTGGIDAIIEPISIPAELKVMGVVRELVSTSDYLPKEWMSNAVFARRDFLKAKPKMVSGVVKAFIEAARFITGNEAWSIEKMKQMSHYSEEAARLVYKQLNFTRDGKIRKKALENVLNFYIKQGIISKESAPSLETLYTMEFTR